MSQMKLSALVVALRDPLSSSVVLSSHYQAPCPEFEGSHLGLPFSSVHRMAGLGDETLVK